MINKLSMSKCILLVLGGAIALTAISGYAGHQRILLDDLINNPDKYDQRVVSFQAEVIGDSLRTESGNWFNVTSGSYHIGVFLDDLSFLEKIEHWGSYSEEGDLVELRGLFYQNCPAHHQLGIHLIDLEVVKRGKMLTHEVSSEKKFFALISFIICLTTGLIYFIKRKWLKKSKS